MRTWLAIIAISGFLSVAGTGQNAVQPSDDNNEMVAQNRTCKLAIPNDWKPISDPTGKSVLLVGDMARAQFLSIAVIDKSDFDGSIADYLNEEAGTILAHLQNPSESQPVSREVGGLPAQEVRIAGSENRYKSIYTITIAESQSRYYRILTFTRPSAEREANEIFAKVLATFSPIEAGS